MSINRTEFKAEFNHKFLPDWICPSCHKGVLKKDDKSIKLYEKALSSSLRVSPAWEPEWEHGVFSAILTCSNPSCKDIVIVTGNFCSEENIEYDAYGNAGPNIDRFLTPTNFNPPLNIFIVHENVPKVIKNEIIKSFGLYWLDFASCANKIRIVLELIMDNKKVKKSTISNKGKRVYYDLHTRIDLFKKKFPEKAKLLMANKWIGNAGSHKNTNLTQDDILDGFEILELVLNQLYGTDTKRITRKASEINKRKGPIGTSKSTK